jgi:thymidylate synthase (FAD)
MAQFKEPFNKKSNAPANALSPLNQDKMNIGIDNIDVKLIDYPDDVRMKKTLSKMVQATIGGFVEESISDEIGQELFKGGLQTGLEAFVFVFEISGVSRACTHQLVRTRKATFHQQSSRYTNMGKKFNVRMPKTISDNSETKYAFSNFVQNSRMAYEFMIEHDIPFQDARFVCPVGLETYIIAEYPVKVFLDTYAYRACPMFQWEIVHIFNEMKNEVVKIFPWMDEFVKISCEKIKKCMFQGWESTDGVCDFEWNHERIFKSETFTMDSHDDGTDK